jgi:glycopeptide antibiotics resistance protein
MQFLFFRYNNMPSRLPIKIISGIVLVAYLLVLTKKVLFKQGGPRHYKQYFSSEYKNYSVSKGWKKANTVPFATINLYKKGLQHHNSIAEYNLLGNFIGFVPFGILLPLFWPWFRHGIKTLLAGFMLSLGFETVQLLTGLGVWDVDDLLLNTAGTIAGYILFFMVSTTIKLMNRKPVLQTQEGVS